ncbi:MAG: signal peptidase II [Anaerolineae bacterium]|nr:signal peptidase II [Anaerolineae bacterium]
MSSASKNSFLIWCGAVFVLIADQLSKHWILQNLTEYKTVDFIPWLTPVLSLTRLSNTGVAFGLFPQFGGLFTILSSIIILIIIWFYRTLEVQSWPIQLAFGMQIGGALGNLIDRLLRGSVVDFIDLNFWPVQKFAIFNLADSAIVVGVGILLLCIWLEEEFREQPEESPTHAE